MFLKERLAGIYIIPPSKEQNVTKLFQESGGILVNKGHGMNKHDLSSLSGGCMKNHQWTAADRTTQMQITEDNYKILQRYEMDHRRVETSQ